jgi:hypothetical protein
MQGRWTITFVPADNCRSIAHNGTISLVAIPPLQTGSSNLHRNKLLSYTPSDLQQLWVMEIFERGGMSIHPMTIHSNHSNSGSTLIGNLPATCRSCPSRNALTLATRRMLAHLDMIEMERSKMSFLPQKTGTVSINKGDRLFSAFIGTLATRLA